MCKPGRARLCTSSLFSGNLWAVTLSDQNSRWIKLYKCASSGSVEVNNIFVPVIHEESKDVIVWTSKTVLMGG